MLWNNFICTGNVCPWDPDLGPDRDRKSSAVGHHSADPCRNFAAMDRRLIWICTITAALCGCETPPGSAEGSDGPAERAARSPWDMPTESYTGTLRGNLLTFEHLNYERFRLMIAGEMIEGEMATEQGFGTDYQATLYLLNVDRPESEQAYFVRYSSGELQMLDPQRRPMREVKFRKR
jgi:hypothetical protein